MTKPTDSSKDNIELRQRAERRLAGKKAAAPDQLSDQHRLVHELQVHQVELEMQNEALQEARNAAETALERCGELFEFAPIAYFILSVDGILQHTNSRGEQLLGRDRLKLARRHFVESVSTEYRPVFNHFLTQVFANDGTQSCEIALRTGENKCWVVIEATADKNRQTCLAAVLDITEKKQAEEIVHNQANIDPLTGLPNRRLFLDRLQRAINKSHRAHQKLALMFLDLDHFKDINDTLGHDMGDLLLKEATQRLTNCIRETDTLARPGGDEFTAIMDELHDFNSIERVAQSILLSMTEPFQLNHDRCHVSISIGIALYPDDADNLEDLLKKADQAMYAAKDQGRNRISYFTPAMQEAVELRLRLTNDLRSALDDKQLWMAYQPIVELATGEIRKAEALLRWQHPSHGLISPAEFIPIAEDTGLINEMGRWVFDQAANQVSKWRIDHHPQFQISINKSAAQFRNNGEKISDWFDHLKRLGLPGACIAVEMTEDLFLDSSSPISEELLALKNAGLQTSLDNFGTGYASLSCLKKHPVDYLKIAPSLVSDLCADSTDMALCETIILMAHTLGIKVIAEGVETPEQLDCLLKAGCDYAQGYLFSRPVTADAFERLFQTR
ncbi:MAG: putative bifunctional diguanylate cyclase/phosphodiesterase [Methylomonas sp.]